MNNTAQRVMRVWSGIPRLTEAEATLELCINSISSLMETGEGGDSGPDVGDNGGSLESDRGGVNSPHERTSRNP